MKSWAELLLTFRSIQPKLFKLKGGIFKFEVSPFFERIDRIYLTNHVTDSVRQRFTFSPRTL